MSTSPDSISGLSKTGLLLTTLALGTGSALALGLVAPSPGLLALGLLHGVLAMACPRYLPALLALDTALFSWESAIRSAEIFGQNYDTWLHLGLIRRVLEHGLYPPDTSYLGHIAAPHTSLVHYLHAVAALMTGLPGHTLWRAASPLVVLGLGGAAYFAHRELLQDRAAASLATLFYLGQKLFPAGYATYPRVAAPVFYLLSIGLLTRGLRSRRRGIMFAAGAMLGLAFGTHPVTGVMAVLVVGGVLVVEGLRQLRSGMARPFLIRIAWLALGAALAAGPWLIGDLMAFFARSHHPVQLQFNALLQSRLVLEYVNFLPQHGPPSSLTRIWPLLLWAGPVLVGLFRLLAKPRDPALLAYIGVAIATPLIAVASPLTPLLVKVVTAAYVARFVEVLPLAALAGLGLASLLPHDGSVARPARSSSRRSHALTMQGLASALVVFLCSTAVLHGVRPWEKELRPPTASRIQRPELEEFEPLIHGRVVLADADTAYVLPYFTGAFLAWNERKHLNPWVYDAERAAAARAILMGEMNTSETLAFCERYDVDFLLLPREKGFAERGRVLTDSHHFEQRKSNSRYLLIERTDDG